MNLTEIEIIPVKPRNGLVALASFVLNDDIYCGGIGILARPNGEYRLTYPTKITHNRSMHLFHPINHFAGQTIEKAIIGKYKALMGED